MIKAVLVYIFLLQLTPSIHAQEIKKDSIRIVDQFTSAIGNPQKIDSLRSDFRQSFNNKSYNLKDIYWFNLSKTLFYTGLLDEAFLASDTGLLLHKQAESNYEAAKYYNIKASIFSFKKDNESAIAYFQKALKILEDNKDEYTAALIKNNIANIFFSLSDYESAYKYSNESYTQLKKENDSINLPGVEGITAITAFKLGKTEEGKKTCLIKHFTCRKIPKPYWVDCRKS